MREMRNSYGKTSEDLRIESRRRSKPRIRYHQDGRTQDLTGFHPLHYVEFPHIPNATLVDTYYG